MRFLKIVLAGLLLLAGCRAVSEVPAAVPTRPAADPAPTQHPAALPTARPVTSRPTSISTSAAAVLTPTPAPSPTAVFPVFKPQVGVQIHLHNEDLDAIIDHLRALGVGWVKVQVSWKLFQPEPDRLDDVLFAEVDALVDASRAAGIQVLLGVAKAPEWSRVTTEQDGPPRDPAAFAEFMRLLAGRYAGRVAAYELWNETNLRREWFGVPLEAADFVALVAVGARAVREIDPAARVISGAPAPTGIDDGISAVDDRVYFARALAAGLAAHVDAFGIHPYGWANPPDATTADPGPRPSHNDHPSFFFRETVDDYGEILRAHEIDPAAQPLWATEFGWAATDGMGSDPVPGAEWMAGVSEAEQAAYTLRALAIGAGRPELGPMILWNLNFAPTLGTAFAESAYSLLRPDGSPRPVYAALHRAP